MKDSKTKKKKCPKCFNSWSGTPPCRDDDCPMQPSKEVRDFIARGVLYDLEQRESD